MNTSKLRVTFGVVCFLGCLIGQQAFAVGARDFAGFHELSACGGIAAPASSTAVFSNPAGLVYNNRLRLSAQGGTHDNSFDDPVLRGGLLYGNSSFGLAGGVNYRSRGPGETSAFYGLGVHSGSLRTAIGVSGESGISPSSGTDFNAGVLLFPRDRFTLGITAYGLKGGPDVYGLGFGFEFQHGLKLIVDSTVDKDLKNAAVQPGIWVGNYDASLTLSYGTSLEDRGAIHQLTDGVAIGGSLQIGYSLSWQVYYSQFAKYYTALTFSF